ncbi:ammonium transporter [Alphaproteobacteria bacterium]|jgi:Amt family ammonium transporter|nr:ammonium transporter [Alphaproteobacteria bacterium]
MFKTLLSIFALIIAPSVAYAAIDPETAYILNSLSFLMHGFIVMLMAAGFCMLEAGLVRTKNTAVQCTKNIGLYAISGLMFWLVGYNLLYMDVDTWIGSLAIWSPSEVNIDDKYSSGSDWFFQMVFVAAAASIVSGAVAERVKLISFLIFSAVLTGFIYPIQGSWSWGEGYLKQIGFLDFAGSTIVHSVGGWAALMGVLIIGARHGKYGKDGRVNPMPGSNLPLATLGTFVLWFGWFGFNGGSQLAMGSAEDVNAIANIYINTNIAAAAGVVVALFLSYIRYGKVELTMTLNGALAGLVAITAEPLMPSVPMAAFIGGIGGLIVVVTVPLLDKLKIDDVVGAIPVHLFAGIWGTIAVVFSNPDATLTAQLTGIVLVGVFVSVASAIVWYALALTLGIRASKEDEINGLDLSECGLEAYPEFSRG